MSEAGIFVPFRDLTTDDDLRTAVTRYAMKQLGVCAAQLPESAPEEEGLQKLSVTDAGLFLNTCSEKTLRTLEFIVANGGRISASDLHQHLEAGDLRGVWTGLTRRLRNITQKDDAKLLNWFKSGNDWRIVMARATVDSLRQALAHLV